jgi:ribosomal protein S18 acetylase RimI-like enzyme
VTTINDKPVCFNAVLPFPHGNIKNGYRMSRIVVLPDYQGLGVGGKITDYIASLYAKKGRTMYVKTSNPALWAHLDKSPNWHLTTEVTKEQLNSEWMEKMQTADKSGMLKYRNAITKSYKWIGEKSQDDTDIILFKNEVYKHVAQNQISMF